MWKFQLTQFTMWLLIINTNFATAELRHFEMQKYPKKENFWKKDYFTQDLNMGPQKLLHPELMPYH